MFCTLSVACVPYLGSVVEQIRASVYYSADGRIIHNAVLPSLFLLLLPVPLRHQITALGLHNTIAMQRIRLIFTHRRQLVLSYGLPSVS